MSKSKKSHLIRWSAALYFILISSLCFFSFQNCSGSTSQLTETSQSSVSQINLNSSGYGSTDSYIFSGEYRANASDLTGIKLCDYPDLTNCKTDADGKSKGRGHWEISKLNPASQVHIMKFNFISNGFLSKNTSVHFAMGLRGKITKDAAGDPTAVNGRGFIIGYLGGHPDVHDNPTCQTRHGVIETYHGDAYVSNNSLPANHLFSASCTDSIFQDGENYKVEVYVSRSRKIGYKIFDSSLKLIHQSLVQDPTDYIDLNDNEWFIAHVFDSPITSPAGNWNLIIQNIELTESNAPVESYFTEKILNFRLGTTALADNALVSAQQMLSQPLNIGPLTALRSRLYGCANPVTSVDSGAACVEASGFREIAFAGDESFSFANGQLSFINEALNPYPANTYKLILRLNPFDSQNQYSVRVTKP